jgi:hypothetical protein
VDATVETRRNRIFAMLEDISQQGKGPDWASIMEEAARKRELAASADSPPQNEIPPPPKGHGQSPPDSAPPAALAPELQSFADDLPADDDW